MKTTQQLIQDVLATCDAMPGPDYSHDIEEVMDRADWGALDAIDDAEAVATE